MNIVYRYKKNQFVVRAEHRVEALRSMGVAVAKSDIDAGQNISLPRSRVLPGPKVMVFQRIWVNFQQWPELINFMRKNRWLVVFDIDDSPEFIRQRLYPQLSKEEYQTNRCAPLLLSHAVQASTRALSLHLYDEGWRAPMGVLENSMLRMGPWQSSARPDGAPARVIYAGTPRGTSFEAILPALKKIEDKHSPDWSILGPPEFSFKLAQALGARSINRLPVTDYDTYLKTLGLHDIAIAPLDRTPGHEFKSDVKFIEAASQGCAMVASPTVYENTIARGKTGLIADSVDEWFMALDRLISEPKFLNEIQMRARAYVAEHRMMMPSAKKQVVWYQEMANNYEALDQALVERAESIGMTLPALHEL